MYNPLNNALNALAARRAQKINRRITWLSDRLGLSEPTIIDATHLRQLPAGTFGRTWIDTLDAAGLSPLVTGPRRQQLHDGVHVLTGYGTDLLGEAQLQAFLMGAKFRLFHGALLLQMLLAVVVVRPVVCRGERCDRITLSIFIRHLHQAYQRGRQSQLDPDRWQPEKLWLLPTAEVRRLFQVG